MDADAVERQAQTAPRSDDRIDAPERRERRRLRYLGPILAIALAGLLVALLAYGLAVRAPDRTIDDRLLRAQAVEAPSFRLAVLRRAPLGVNLTPKVAPALADGFVSNEELRGVPYVLNFWASWCIPCREEAPLLQRTWRQMRERGVLFVGLNMQDVPGDAREFMDEFGLDFLNIRDPTNEIARRYGVTGIPETFFVSARGEIVGHVIGVVAPVQLGDGISAAVAGRPHAARQGGDRRPTR